LFLDEAALGGGKSARIFMVTADVYVSEQEFKNQESFRGLVSSRYLPALSGEGVTVVEALRWESKMVVETIEIAALWLADTDSLALKLDCASYCGDRARHFRLLADRLAALGLAPGSYDPRQGGYSRLYGFLRSLQTSEERAAAGFVALAGMSATRLGALAAFCDDRGDGETARLVRDSILPDEERRVELGRDTLVALVTADDTQARARRASYRVVELLTELYDPAMFRKLSGRGPTRK
jgi:hypothetical protein